MGKNNYFSIEKKDHGYCVVLGNFNGKKIFSRETFSYNTAVANAFLLARQNRVEFIESLCGQAANSIA